MKTTQKVLLLVLATVLMATFAFAMYESTLRFHQEMISCTETDEGYDIGNQGVASWHFSFFNGNNTDFCMAQPVPGTGPGQGPIPSGPYLNEYQCDGNVFKTWTVACDCMQGACNMNESNNQTGNCIDTDGGKDYLLLGSTFGYDAEGNYGDWMDYCFFGYNLIEYYCENDTVQSEQTFCYQGCFDGACTPPNNEPACEEGWFCQDDSHRGYQLPDCSWIEEEECSGMCYDGECVEPQQCTDSDGGLDIFTLGTVHSFGPIGDYQSKDTCQGSTSVEEYYCSDVNWVESSVFVCPNGYHCDDGACRAPQMKVTKPSKI